MLYKKYCKDLFPKWHVKNNASHSITRWCVKNNIVKVVVPDDMYKNIIVWEIMKRK